MKEVPTELAMNASGSSAAKRCCAFHPVQWAGTITAGCRCWNAWTVGSITGLLTKRRLGLLAVKEGPDHFEPLASLCVAGEVQVCVDRTFGLDEVPDALAYVGEGRALGKAVVEVS